MCTAAFSLWFKGKRGCVGVWAVLSLTSLLLSSKRCSRSLRERGAWSLSTLYTIHFFLGEEISLSALGEWVLEPLEVMGTCQHWPEYPRPPPSRCLHISCRSLVRLPWVESCPNTSTWEQASLKVEQLVSIIPLLTTRLRSSRYSKRDLYDLCIVKKVLLTG